VGVVLYGLGDKNGEHAGIEERFEDCRVKGNPRNDWWAIGIK
jgi:hypothetical protein